jgi:hypothetical protein
MKTIDARHPYFDRVECGDSECVVSLSRAFPVRGFRLAVVERGTGYVEVAANLGFRHDDGGIDWVQGGGDTLEEAVVSALQFFLNLVVHPENVSDSLVWRDAIA